MTDEFQPPGIHLGLKPRGPILLRAAPEIVPQVMEIVMNVVVIANECALFNE
ncbi:hypothetical protein Pmar_PMAR027280 [Perkinsus marinus ATCC 50983]|nr:hypothetical protein Pmar_PMAR027280 [Perkinsus marinus ATCC 50983]EER09317.1 hypothetical protein Pmar_PMAR027280 [Perkinsus marinus ATCC 50983]|eukprot:XP_002777501.1 hypothetical protein Pmar_PMAR027280 [Perkinsus marinus ATCC 50983]